MMNHHAKPLTDDELRDALAALQRQHGCVRIDLDFDKAAAVIRQLYASQRMARYAQDDDAAHATAVADCLTQAVAQDNERLAATLQRGRSRERCAFVRVDRLPCGHLGACADVQMGPCSTDEMADVAAAIHAALAKLVKQTRRMIEAREGAAGLQRFDRTLTDRIDAISK